MSLFKQYATNQTKEQTGVAIEFGTNEDGTVPTFYLSRMAKANKRYSKAMELKFRPHQRAIQSKTLSDDLANRLMLEVFVESVITGYENIQDENGKAITTNEGVIDLFTKLPDLHAELEENAKDISLFRDEDVEAAKGN